MSADSVPPVSQTASQAAGPLRVQADGRVVFTHGHRYPDNVQRITQTHRPDGMLESAHITWSGFAGPVLDITATFDAAGKLLREDGYRAAGVKDTVGCFLLPLPVQAGATQPGPAPAVTQPETQSALQELSGLSGLLQPAKLEPAKPTATPAASPAPEPPTGDMQSR